MTTTIHGAKAKAATLLVATETARAAFREALGDPLVSGNHDPEEIPHGNYQQARRKYETFMTECAAVPALRAEMSPWMVDFSGTQSDVRHDPDLEGDALTDAIRADVSTFARSVRMFIEEKHDCTVTDSGSGAGGWDLGALCSDEQSARLCRAAQDEFAPYIAAGMLTVSLKFWGWRFTDVGNTREAKEFLARLRS